MGDLAYACRRRRSGHDANAQQVTFDDVEDWFPHCSPDGKWLVFVTFPKGTATHDDRMPGVQLRMIPFPGTKLRKDCQHSAR